MASPTSPTIMIPALKRLVYGVESVAAGTAATTGLVQEAVNDIKSTLQRTPIEHREFTGTASDLVGFSDAAKYMQIVVDCPLRVNGFAAQALACLMGNASDTVSGTVAPYTHTLTPSATNTRMNTMTIWHDTGDKSNIMQMTWATVQSVKLTYQPTQQVQCQVTMLAQAPTYQSTVTPTAFIGTAPYDKRRALGYQGTFTIFNSAATVYLLPGTSGSTTNTVIGGDITISRPVDPYLVGFNVTPQDFIPGVLDLQGTFDMRYDGAASTSVWQDYVNLKELGTSTNPHKVQFAIDANNSWELDFWPIVWQSDGLSDQNQTIRQQVTFHAYNDLGTVNSATPALSAVKQMIIKNAQATAMVS